MPMVSQHNLEHSRVSQEWNLREFLVVAELRVKDEKWRDVVIFQDKSCLMGHLELRNGN